MMRSQAAEQLRETTRDAARALPLDERLEHMLELGEQGLQAFMDARGLSRDDAMREIEKHRQSGRQRSRSMEWIIDASRPQSSDDSR